MFVCLKDGWLCAKYLYITQFSPTKKLRQVHSLSTLPRGRNRFIFFKISFAWAALCRSRILNSDLFDNPACVLKHSCCLSTNHKRGLLDELQTPLHSEKSPTCLWCWSIWYLTYWRVQINIWVRRHSSIKGNNEKVS